jgi:hypothetical protein
MRRHNAVRGIGAGHIEITVLESALSLVEHIEGLRFVLFDRRNCFLKQGFGFVGCTVLASLTCPRSGKYQTD